MKKLFVLLIAAAVAVGASAGVNKKAINPNAKFSQTEAKAKAADRMTFKKGDVIPSTPLQAFVENGRIKANHALKDGENLFWDFEDEAQMNDWVTLDEDGDGYGWYYATGEGIVAHSGVSVLSSESYVNYVGALYPDNWLVSPWVELNGSFSFWAAGQDPSWAGEVFAVYIYTDGNPEWVKISDDLVATGIMKQYVFDLSEYEGLSGSIAIRHYNVTDMFRLNVDDITIGDVEIEPEPEAPEIIYDVPETCVIKEYYRNSSTIYSSMFGIGGGQTNGKFNVAFDTNGDVYVQNPMWWYDGNNAWVKGTYDELTGIISIPTGQFLSWNADYQYGVCLGMGSSYVTEEWDEEYEEYAYMLNTLFDERATEIQMQIVDDNIFLLGTDGDFNAEFPDNYNAYGLFAYYNDDLSWAGAIEFANPDAPFGYIVNLVPAVPANPTADEWYDCGDESGFSRFYFTLPTTDVDGNMLDPEHISYSVYVDNGNGPELFTFSGDAYTFDLEPGEEYSEVEYWLYSNAVDFRDYVVYFYRTNADGFEPLFTENIGIQAFYTVDGVKNASDIVWLYDTHVNVNEINAGKTVANVRYFNVAGQEMAQPEGMTIKVTTYTDGTTSAVKVVK